jgi:triosephosphate isomerase
MSRRIPIIAGNWKMHKTHEEAKEFARAIKGMLEADDVESVICAPFTALAALQEELQGTSIQLGAQNMHWESKGAYTGEISASMLRALGVNYVIIGHSERRMYFAETDETVNKKVKAAFASGLTPIVCVGENLAQRERGETKSLVRSQVLAAVAGCTPEEVSRIVIAYEPIWAIGTGKSSSAAEAGDVITEIRNVLAEVYTTEVADQVRIQYGGSVTPANIGSFMEQKDIDGALVGGASLTADSFFQLVDGARGGIKK